MIMGPSSWVYLAGICFVLDWISSISAFDRLTHRIELIDRFFSLQLSNCRFHIPWELVCVDSIRSNINSDEQIKLNSTIFDYTSA